MAIGGNGGALRKGSSNNQSHNDKIRKALIGNKNGAGKRSNETRMKMSNSRKGMKFSEEHRKNLSISHMGNKNAMKKEQSFNVSI